MAGTSFSYSTDQGNSWSEPNPAPSTTPSSFSSPVDFSSSIVVDPKDPAHVWLGGDTGLWESKNYGGNWRQVLQCPVNLVEANWCITSVALDPSNGLVLYAADDVGIWKVTYNQDASYNPVRIDLSTLGLPQIRDGYYIVLGAGSQPHFRLYASFAARKGLTPSIKSDISGCLVALIFSDNGNDWHKVAAPVDSYQPKALPDYFWTVYPNGLPPVVNGKLSGACSKGSGQAFYDDALAVDPKNVDHVSVAGLDVIQSNDGGGTWKDLSQNLGVHSDIHALAYDESGGLYVASDGGVDHLTEQREMLSYGLTIMQFYPGATYLATKGMLLAGTQDNGTNLVSFTAAAPPGDQTWTSKLPGDGGATAIDPTNPSHIYAENYLGVLRYSADGGQCWQRVARGNQLSDLGTGRNCPPDSGGLLWWQKQAAFVMPFTISPTNFNGADRRTLYAGAEEVYSSLDGGSSWKALSNSGASTGTFVQTMDVQRYNNGTVDAIAAGWNNGTLMSYYGAGWVDLTGAISNGLGVSGVSMDPDNPTHLYVVVNNEVRYAIHIARGGGVFEFADATRNPGPGAAADITGNLKCTPFTVKVFASRVFVGCDDGVYLLDKSSGSPTWNRYGGSTLPTVAVYDLLHVNNTLIAVTHGLGIWKATTDF